MRKAQYKFKPEDFIEFSRRGPRGPRSAKERRNIAQGLQQFWDKKGRAVLTVGAAGLATGGALALAARTGRIPGKGIKNISQKVMSGKKASSLLPPASGVSNQPRLLPGGTTGNIAKNVPGVDSKNIVTQVAKTTGGAGGRAYGAGKATRKAVAEGIRDAKPSDPAYKVGRAAHSGLQGTKKAATSIARRIKRASRRK